VQLNANRWGMAMDMDAIHPIQPPNFPAGLHVKVEMLTQSRLYPFPSPFRPPGKTDPWPQRSRLLFAACCCVINKFCSAFNELWTHQREMPRYSYCVYLFYGKVAHLQAVISLFDIFKVSNGWIHSNLT